MHKTTYTNSPNSNDERIHVSKIKKAIVHMYNKNNEDIKLTQCTSVGIVPPNSNYSEVKNGLATGYKIVKVPEFGDVPIYLPDNLNNTIKLSNEFLNSTLPSVLNSSLSQFNDFQNKSYKFILENINEFVYHTDRCNSEDELAEVYENIKTYSYINTLVYLSETSAPMAPINTGDFTNSAGRQDSYYKEGDISSSPVLLTDYGTTPIKVKDYEIIKNKLEEADIFITKGDFDSILESIV